MDAEQKKSRCIIIGAGELTAERIEVFAGDLVVAVDGGYAYSEVLGIEPDYIIGDFDSISQKCKSKLEMLKKNDPDRVIQLCPEKDDTDMLAALKLGLECGCEDFQIYAATGGRLEHTIANIQCLLYLKNKGAVGCFCDGKEEIFVMKDEEIHFPGSREGYLSLFPLGKEARGITIRGLKYPLENYTMRNDFPIGVSNEFIGCESTVSVRDGELVGIICRKESNEL